MTKAAICRVTDERGVVRAMSSFINPITAPAEIIELITPLAIDIFSLGNLSLTMLKAIPKTDIPNPCIALVISKKYMLVENPAKDTPIA